MCASFVGIRSAVSREIFSLYLKGSVCAGKGDIASDSRVALKKKKKKNKNAKVSFVAVSSDLRVNNTTPRARARVFYFAAALPLNGMSIVKLIVVSLSIYNFISCVTHMR